MIYIVRLEEHLRNGSITLEYFNTQLEIFVERGTQTSKPTEIPTFIYVGPPMGDRSLVHGGTLGHPEYSREPREP